MHRTLEIVLGTIVLAATTALVPLNTPASAAASGITGTISGASSGDFATTVHVVPVATYADDQASGRTYATSDGSFTIPLDPGRYWVEFASFERASEWWGDAVTRGTSTQVVVTADSFTTLDPLLERGGSIVGTVPEAAGPGGETTEGFVEVWATDPTRPDGRELVGLTRTDPATGTFQVPALHTGSYLVHTFTRRTKLEGWYADGASVATAAEATPVTVAAPGDTTIEVDGLRAQGYLAGRLTRADGIVLSGADVSVLPRDDDGAFGRRFTDATITTTGGRWAIQVPAGTYRVRFSDTERDGVRTEGEFWHDAQALADAGDLAVSVGAITVADEVVEPTSIVVRTPPRQRGVTQVGRTLTVTSGSFYPTTARVSYQWLRNGRAVPGAVRSSYRLRPEDAGDYVAVRVTIARAGYGSAVVTVAPGDPTVDRAVLRRVSRARFSGALRVGSTLRATAPRTVPRSTPHYQWRRGGSAIRGAVRPSYTLRAADRDEYVSLWVTSRRPGYEPTRWVVQRFDAVEGR